MCTVTYIPQSDRNFILTSNRDETATRSPQNLSIDKLKDGTELLFPRDEKAGGTWIVAAADGRVACLLNGAFTKHKHRPPYRRSRGLMVLDFFTFPSAEDFAKNYDFEGIEPFTFVLVGKNKLHELRWDEQKAHLKPMDSKDRHIWSSTTLYPPEIQAKRNHWFNEWQKGRDDFGLRAIQDFHQYGGEKDEWNGFIMNRMNLVQTVSITNVVKQQNGMKMIYNDLLRKRVLDKHIEFNKNILSLY